MTNFDIATNFFHACEGLKGAEGCKQYISEGAKFKAQCEPLIGIDNVLDYCDWMAGLGKGALKGCSYILHSSSYDEATKTALFFGTFKGRHVGEGGPIPPTMKEANADYVYALTFNDNGKIIEMTKIWNAPWTLRELGWA
ncbi:MAG: hypothetical protein K9G26_08680 [Emcibacter sp.]|nr:hypothetical protein [Emcibacter sp.]